MKVRNEVTKKSLSKLLVFIVVFAMMSMSLTVFVHAAPENLERVEMEDVRGGYVPNASGYQPIAPFLFWGAPYDDYFWVDFVMDEWFPNLEQVRLAIVAALDGGVIPAVWPDPDCLDCVPARRAIVVEASDWLGDANLLLFSVDVMADFHGPATVPGLLYGAAMMAYYRNVIFPEAAEWVLALEGLTVENICNCCVCDPDVCCVCDDICCEGFGCDCICICCDCDPDVCCICADDCCEGLGCECRCRCPLPPNRAPLREAITSAGERQEINYTADTWAAFQAALNAARAVYADPNASQADLNDAKNALYAAKGELVRLQDVNDNEIENDNDNEIENENDNDNDNDNDDARNGAPRTGDSSPVSTVLYMSSSMTVILAIMVLLWKDRRKKLF